MTGLNVALNPDQKAEARQIAKELAAIATSGQVLPGSLTSRLTNCGRPGCKCMADPPQPHGPYWLWTRKVAAKTAGRWLSADQANDYQTWIANHRRLRELTARLDAIGIAALESDPRTSRRR
jgi:hypothetical protein